MNFVAIVISCAGDSELAARLLQHLLKLSLEANIDGDEIIVAKESVGHDDLNQMLQAFLSANSDLAGLTLTSFDDIFTIGTMRNIDELVTRCETCGYITQHEDEMMIHKRIHAMVKLL